MAIYHLSSSIIKRSAGRSATAAAAYRGALLVTDERTGDVHDYRRKRGVIVSGVIAPDHAPAWARDAVTLWNHVEHAERRKDAQLARELTLALPHELSDKQRMELVRDFVKAECASLGMTAYAAIHAPHDNRDGSGNDNHHAHVMLTMRPFDGDGFGKKCRDWNRPEQLWHWREAWATHCNAALERAGETARIDHRSYAARGIDRPATVHLGPQVTAMERRGIKTRVGSMNRAIRLQQARLQVLSDTRVKVRAERAAGTLAQTKAAVAASRQAVAAWHTAHPIRVRLHRFGLRSGTLDQLNATASRRRAELEAAQTAHKAAFAELLPLITRDKSRSETRCKTQEAHARRIEAARPKPSPKPSATTHTKRQVKRKPSKVEQRTETIIRGELPPKPGEPFTTTALSEYVRYAHSVWRHNSGRAIDGHAAGMMAADGWSRDEITRAIAKGSPLAVDDGEHAARITAELPADAQQQAPAARRNARPDNSDYEPPAPSP